MISYIKIQELNLRPAIQFLYTITTGLFLFHIATFILLGLPIQSWAKTAASEISVPGNIHLRAVWVQDIGDGRDVFAQDSNLRLMGLDTRDGMGERMILGTAGNYAKPLITPRGDRVVYSDRIRKKIYVVNWDGSGLRELLGGFGLALWRDPMDGREWLYYGNEKGKNGQEYCPAVYRRLLDTPGPGELVWNRTPVSVNSFQLSADGRMAGGLFPWPDGGVAHLTNRSINLYAKGCWTSLTSVQDNNYLWIFDGAHRNLTVFDLQNNKRWQVNISGALGINGHEVYHPRWSNNPQIITITGPYTVKGFGVNPIFGGGPAVEIYVGRFNTDLTNIESWWRITKNDRADFFPDVWVASEEGGKQTAKMSRVKKANLEKPSEGNVSRKMKSEKVSVDPGKTIRNKTIPRVVVEARLTDPSGIPTPQDIAPYRRALLVNGYEIVRVISGSYRQKKVMAAHWVIEDGQVIEDAKRKKGKTYRMVLERFDDHPELEGERLIMDSDEFRLPLFFELPKGSSK